MTTDNNSGSESDPAVTSDEDVSQTFTQSDSASYST